MGDRTTMRDIADALGLSVNAISLALNNRAGVSDRTRAQVIKTAYDMGYFEANRQAMRKIKLKNICILCKNKVLTDIHFHNIVFTAMQSTIKAHGYDVIMETTDTLSTMPPCIEEGRVSGAIVIGTYPDEAILRVRDSGVPMILVNHEILMGNVDTLVNKNFQGAALAVRHLHDMGHRRIGFAGHPDASSLRMRWAGFRQAALELDLYGDRFDELYRAYAFERDLTPYLITLDFPGIARLVLDEYGDASRLPSAFFCDNDATAIGLMRAVSLLGVRVPDDLSLVAFDNIDSAAQCIPALTTVAVPIRAMGERAVERLMWRMEHPDEPYETISMEMHLLSRDTVRRISNPNARGDTIGSLQAT